MPKPLASISSPRARVSSPLPSATMRTLPSAPCALPQAPMTKASFTDRQTTSSMPLPRRSAALSTNPGRCFIEQVGVNAPGTANSTTVLPLVSSPTVTGFGPLSPISMSFVSAGSVSPALIIVVSSSGARCVLFDRQGAWRQSRATMADDLRQRSRTLYDGPNRAPARSSLKATGFPDRDIARPIVGIANTWTGTMPGNLTLRGLAQHVARGIREAGGTPMEFNTIAISDGITMGTEGMKTSLVSREVIADSIELVARGHMFDALVVLVGCDKTIPGGAMALLRLDVPGLVLYGGSIQPGLFREQSVTILNLFEAVGAHAAGKITDADLR